MTVAVMRGEVALSDFRLQQIALKAEAAGITTPKLTGSEFYYLVESAENLAAPVLKQLESILRAKYQGTDYGIDGKTGVVAVFPRRGTVSPWASKARDILRLCGQKAVTRIEKGIYFHFSAAAGYRDLLPFLFDRMTEEVYTDPAALGQIFNRLPPPPLTVIDFLRRGKISLDTVNKDLGLALAAAEITYLESYYRKLARNPTDVELMMFAQANSEHCRHKIFNADFNLNGKKMPGSLFSLIKETYKQHPQGTVVAYNDNAAVIAGCEVEGFYAGENTDRIYTAVPQLTHMVLKVETHNHPTAISPLAGAATGAGGEIRDEGATGRGGRPKAGLCGFTVSDLLIPDFVQPWETAGELPCGKPQTIASPLQIMLEAPVGAAAFNNEFGRPNLLGYFRTLTTAAGGRFYGYHKPIMLAGGLGNIAAGQTVKKKFSAGALLVVLGGPGFAIGLGGGAASSVTSGINHAQLDFASVQRANPEMQRRCQEVINQCAQMGEDNPILAIHDVGAGGLSNAFPELVHDSQCGAVFALRAIPVEEEGMSPREIWCNEAQERYVLAIAAENLTFFQALCTRERCPSQVVGTATADLILRLEDRLFGNEAVNLPLSVLFGKPPLPERTDNEADISIAALPALERVTVKEALYRILRLPAVAAKNFLITIGDRTVGGLTHRDQLVGPYQVAVADCTVTNMGFFGYSGEVMSLGERTPLGINAPAASARMAIGEALTNMMSALIGPDLAAVKLSANWMAACDVKGETAKLYRAVEAASKLCQELGIAIPVGKDSLSMRVKWEEGRVKKDVVSPVSLIITAAAVTADVRCALTPQLQNTADTVLLLIDLGGGNTRLGGSALAQVYGYNDLATPDLDDAARFKTALGLVQELLAAAKILAVHDRSDGGLLITLAEMMFASRCGLNINLDELISKIKAGTDNSAAAVIKALFNEELGLVIQVHAADYPAIIQLFAAVGLEDSLIKLGTIAPYAQLTLTYQGQSVLDTGRCILEELWRETSYRLQSLRDNPETAAAEFAGIKSEEAKLSSYLASGQLQPQAYPALITGIKPKVAVLREQGVNGQVELAFAFTRAGFTVTDVHMSDLLTGAVKLADFQVLAAAGGFSYGDVLGAGRGWADVILYNEALRIQFADFFRRGDTLSLGICNGCQMLSALRTLIPGSQLWPDFRRNYSEQFEARLVNVKISSNPGVFLRSLRQSYLPVVISHGEGRAHWDKELTPALVKTLPLALCYVDSQGRPSQKYPVNPNGSALAAAGVTSQDGRVLIMMPHPERVVRTVQLSWCPPDWKGEYSPWLAMFLSARSAFN